MNMAQTTRSTTKKSTSRNGSRANGSASSKSSATKPPSSSSRSKPKSSSSRSKPRSQPKPKSIKDAASDQTQSAGSSIAEAASKAKGPLIAGGTTLVGVAAGALIKSRMDAKQSKNPLKRLGSPSMPSMPSMPNLGKIDLDKVKSGAERVSAYGQQASDIAKAIEKTQKKNG